MVNLKTKVRQNDTIINDTDKRQLRKHLDVSHWLKILELEQYAVLFQNYKGVEELLEFTESDIKDHGIKIAAHRARMMSSLIALRAKYNNNGRYLSFHYSA